MTDGFSPLVSAAELKALLVTGGDVVLLDARTSKARYEEGHLEGARYANPDADLSAALAPGADPARGGRHPLPALAAWGATLGAWGITPATTVVAYDDQAGANAAARAWWMLKSVGHARAAVLDGGLEAAVAAGFALTRDVPRVAQAARYPAAAWSRPTADLAAVDARRNDAAWRVLDVRSRERFDGLTEPFDPIAGHIPGAVNLPFGANLESGRFRSPEALRALYADLLGGRPPGNLVVHCGSGVTACHTLLALERAGLPGASLYVGSWGEWCRSDKPRAPS